MFIRYFSDCYFNFKPYITKIACNITLKNNNKKYFKFYNKSYKFSIFIFIYCIKCV